MPVGCLSSPHVDSTLYISQSNQENGRSSSSPGSGSVSSQAETIALMQQTLLIQIFRREQEQGVGRILEGEGDCPTCQAFSAQCCQEVEGLEVFQEVQEANTAQFWNLPLLKAVVGLKYQGYVCPGILVTLTDSAGVKILQEAWSTHSLATPHGFIIYRLGLSRGCEVTPFKQDPCPGLPETLCLILLKLKQAECVADMNTILSRISRDFPSLNTPNLPATVHAALGSLIKKRKVYYTGKGYFLVSPPDPSAVPKLRPKTVKKVRRSTRENACQTVESVSNGVAVPSAATRGAAPSPSWSSSTATTSQPATPLQHHRQVSRLNSISPQSFQPHLQRTSPRSPLELSPRNSPLHNGVVPPLGPISNSSSSPNSSTDSSLQESPRAHQSTLERSQSLRVSKKSLKQMSKGGSLRLSKKDALAIMTEADENAKNQEVSDERTSPSPKKMERKNSFLGRIFGRRKSNGSPKKEILTFSAQFPPPELEVARLQQVDLNTVETQTPPHVRRKPSSRPVLPPATVSTTQVKNGPNGNFVMYEREYSAGTRNPANRPLPQSPPLYTVASETYDSNSSHIYSQPSLYGATKPPPPAYSSAPPYQPKSPPAVSQRPSLVNVQSSPAPQRPALVTSPGKSTGGQKQVHFAATPRSNDGGGSPRRDSPPNLFKSPPVRRNASVSRSSNSDSSNSGHSSLSGPSSLDSVLYDDTLIVIEKSNHELELRLDSGDTTGSNNNNKSISNNRTQISKNRVDTIHNNRHLDQEVIYEDNLSDLSRSSSASTLKPDSVPDHPSLSDLGSIADLSGKFQSLTARKLMAGLSISSIDTLLEVNAAADKQREKLDESTETIDFGVI